MSRTSLISFACVLVIASAVGFATAGNQILPEMDLQALQHIPADPLAFWAADVGLFDQGFDDLLATIHRFAPEEDQGAIGEKLADFDAKLGFSLRNDLLAHLGPEIGVLIDLPPIDETVGMIMSGAQEDMGQALDGILVWLQTDGDKKIAGRFAGLLTTLGAETEDMEKGVKACWTADEANSTEPPPPCLFLATGDGAIAFGFTPTGAAEVLAPLPAEMRVDTGADYRRVAAHLDSNPDSLIYLNLPRLQVLLSESQMMAMMVSGNAEAKSYWDLLFDSEVTPHGFGSTSVRVGDGSRKVAFGPQWLGSGIATAGIAAAIAIPNLINTTNRSKQKRTLADIRTVGTCMEAYGVDNMLYPATEGWVACSELEDTLSPLYISELPSTDGWGQPLMCISDGRDYTIVSGGRDNSIDQNYSLEFEGRQTTDMDEDIVYRNGIFEIYPSGAQN